MLPTLVLLVFASICLHVLSNKVLRDHLDETINCENILATSFACRRRKWKVQSRFGHQTEFYIILPELLELHFSKTFTYPLQKHLIPKSHNSISLTLTVKRPSFESV